MEKNLKKRDNLLTQQEKEIQQLSEKINVIQRGTIKNFTHNNVVKVLKGGQGYYY